MCQASAKQPGSGAQRGRDTCTAKKQLNVSQNKNYVTPLGGGVVVVVIVVVIVTGASVCIEGQRTTFRGHSLLLLSVSVTKPRLA